jgi:hypothetical protein
MKFILLQNCSKSNQFLQYSVILQILNQPDDNIVEYCRKKVFFAGF